MTDVDSKQHSDVRALKLIVSDSPHLTEKLEHMVHMVLMKIKYK